MGVALLTFAAAATLLIMAPGPDSLLVTRNFFRGGARAGLVTSAGTVSGLLLWSVAAALGLSALVAASRVGYDIVRVAGGCYLVWLGVQSLRSRGISPELGMADPQQRSPGLARAYLNGVLSNLLNPKIGVFFVAFLPGFIPAGAPVSITAAAFGGWFALETGMWLAALVWLLHRGAGWLSTVAVRRWIDRVTGLVLIGFGLRVATEAR
ncbi:MAG TPA: LysE family translocator [Pseudonocardia sp.]|jgi:threonine/homoserine/homoserine lactone efflux protein